MFPFFKKMSGRRIVVTRLARDEPPSDPTPGFNVIGSGRCGMPATCANPCACLPKARPPVPVQQLVKDCACAPSLSCDSAFGYKMLDNFTGDGAYGSVAEALVTYE